MRSISSRERPCFSASTRQQATARQRASDRATTGGFLDSGALATQFTDIDRGEIEAFSSAIRQLLLGLEDRRSEGILPFLSAAANEKLGVGTVNVQAQSATRGQNLNFLSDLIPDDFI